MLCLALRVPARKSASLAAVLFLKVSLNSTREKLGSLGRHREDYAIMETHLNGLEVYGAAKPFT